MTPPDESPARYRIRIRGHLDPSWSTWFDSLTVTQEADGTTELAGPLIDQGALFGLLTRLRDLGATLLLVDVGFGASSAFGGPAVPDADRRAAGQQGPAVHPVPHHRAVRTDPRGP